MMPVETSNRVKSIKTRFENLGEQNIDEVRPSSIRSVRRSNVPVQCSKAYINAKKQLLKQNSEPSLSDSTSKRPVLDRCKEINTAKHPAGESQTFNYKKRLKDDDYPTDDFLSLPSTKSSIEPIKECKVTKSNSAIIGDKPRTLSRQSSDPSRKLQRSPAFRCDRNHKAWDGCRRSLRLNSEESPTLRVGEKPRLSREKLKVLGHLLDQKMKEEKFVLDKPAIDIFRKPSVKDEDVPKRILEQYAKVVKSKNKITNDLTMTDSGISSENENISHESESEKQFVAKPLTAHFELKIDLSDTLKKALKQPLPPGPPPKKPPRTFIAVMSNSSQETSPCSSPCDEQKSITPKKQDSKAMLEKLELALLKHNSGKILTPRTGCLDSPEEINNSQKEISTVAKSPNKDVHYLCTEILGIHNTNDSQGGLSSLAKCFNSLNCANSSIRSSIGYLKLESEGSSVSNGCCSCNAPVEAAKMATFFLPKKTLSPCRKCSSDYCICGKSNPAIEEIVHMSNSTFFAGNIFAGEARTRLKRSKSQEHIYAEPFQHQISSSSPTVPPPLLRGSTLLEDGFRNRKSGKFTFQKASECNVIDFKQNTEPRGMKVRDILHKLESRNSGEQDLSRADNNENRMKTANNIYDAPSLDEEHETVCLELPSRVTYERRCRTVQDRKSRPNGRLAAAKRNQLFRSQMDIDKENLNRLMNDIYDTVAAACQMDNLAVESMRACCRSQGSSLCQCANELGLDDDGSVRRLAKFPVNTDNTDTSSEDSVRLTRSLTEKRKNYVRRVSSRVAYLEANKPGSVRIRYRHQTSVGLNPESTPVVPNGKCTNPYATFRSWKSFKMLNSMKDSDASGSDESGQLDSADGTDTDDYQLGVETGEVRLFDACILVGMNHYTGRAYIKNSFPVGARLPPQIEILVFPEMLSEGNHLSVKSPPSSRRRPNRTVDTKLEGRSVIRRMYNPDANSSQCYSLVLTNERGERTFGYCRRVLPEGATFCLPLAYCVISKYRSTAFFHKILELIESHHGSPDARMKSVLGQLHESKFPQPGESLYLRQPKSPKKSIKCNVFKKNSKYRNSVNLGDIFQARSLEVHTDDIANAEDSAESLESEGGRRRSGDGASMLYDYENNNLEVTSAEHEDEEEDNLEEYTLKMSLEPRMDEDNLSVLLNSMSVSVIVKIFGTLLIERKVVLVSDNLSQLSSCIEALQTILYPFVWQHTLISTVPSEIRRDILEAPIPVLAGVLLTTAKPSNVANHKKENAAKAKTMPNLAVTGEGLNNEEDFEEQMKSVKFEEGMLVDLTSKISTKPVFVQGDESTLLPSYAAKTLKASLSLDGSKEKGKGDSMERTRNFLIAEAFLRFFMDLIGDYWKYFTYDGIKQDEWNTDFSALQHSPDIQFEKEQFVKGAGSKQASYFLEWFTETATFSHFIGNMAAVIAHKQTDSLVDVPYPDFYRLFEERVAQKRSVQDAKKGNKSEQSKSADGSKPANYKLLVGRKVRLLKSKLRDFVNLE